MHKCLYDAHDFIVAGTEKAESMTQKRQRQSLEGVERVIPTEGASKVPLAVELAARAILPFTQLGDYRQGFLIAGEVPKFIVSENGIPRCHPVLLSASGTRCFAELDSEAFPKGMVCIGREEMIFAQLPSSAVVEYRAEWPIRRVELKQTPHFVTYLPTSGTCVVSVSSRQPWRPTKAPFDITILNAKEI